MFPDELTNWLPDALVHGAAIRHVQADEDLFLEGEPATHLVAILSGHVKLWRARLDGTSVSLLMLGRGELVGSVAVAQNSAQLTNATASGALTIASWPATMVRGFLAQDATFADHFLAAVARRARQLLDRFDDVAGLAVDERLSRLLVRMVGEYGPLTRDFTVSLPLRQQDLAELIQSTVPTVSRVLAGFERDGLVECGRGRITIRHLPELALRGGLHLD